MPRSLPISLTDEQWTALQWEANGFGRSPEDHVLIALGSALAETVRRYRETQWATRRRTLEGDATLAAMVDRATP